MNYLVLLNRQCEQPSGGGRWCSIIYIYMYDWSDGDGLGGRDKSIKQWYETL